MNNVYLMKDEKRNYCLFKVGFTSDLLTRMKAYASHNAETECISVVKTQAKSGKNIEKAFHDEVKARGYGFVYSTMNGNKTEWFKVSYEDDFYTELCEKGLNAFKCGKNRKNHGDYASAMSEAKASLGRTMEQVMEKYGDNYDYIVIDSTETAWELSVYNNMLYAVGECGWMAKIDEVHNINKVRADKADQFVYMYIDYRL